MQHIDNLYKNQTILLFQRCFALEKLDGTSAAVTWSQGRVLLSPGGARQKDFEDAFDVAELARRFDKLGHQSVVVRGEAYGGHFIQGHVSGRYGDVLRFGAFLVEVGDVRLAVPQGADVVSKLGLEHVFYRDIPATLEAIDAERDAPSEQSIRNGMGNHPREGVVLRPPIEVRTNNDKYVIAKHKRDDERETRLPRPVVDPQTMVVLSNATDIAFEWVTDKRLEHVLQKLGPTPTYASVVASMTEDVLREGFGEIVDHKETRRAIGQRAAALFEKWKKAAKKDEEP